MSEIWKLIAGNWASVFAGFSAVAAMIGAMAAWRAASATLRAKEVELVLDHLRQYSAHEFANALRILSKLKADHSTDFTEYWMNNKDTPEGVIIRDALRLVKNYFTLPARMHMDGLLSARALRAMTERDGINLFYDVVLPLSVAHDQYFDLRPANVLRLKVGRRGRGDVIEARPAWMKGSSRPAEKPGADAAC